MENASKLARHPHLQLVAQGQHFEVQAAMLGVTVQTKRSPETGDLSLQVVLVAGARNQRYLEFPWAVAELPAAS
jgi:hypothetical protein